MAEQKVELRKTRDLSENLNDTFGFIKQNFKPLVTSFLAIAGIFMLLSSIFTGLYESRVGGLLRDIITRGEEVVSTFRLFTGAYPVVIILTLLNINAMQVVIASYIKVYELKGGETPVIEEVWEVFKKYYLLVLAYSIPIYLSIAIGFIFCLLPGIYLAVVFIPFAAVVIFEDQSFSGAYSRCFAIIKENFWSSFVIYLLVYIIYSFAGGIISTVMGAITGLISYFTTKNVNATIGISVSVLSAFSFVFYLIYYVSVTLHYFSLTEKIDNTGLMRRLEKLGNQRDNFNNIQEQY